MPWGRVNHEARARVVYPSLSVQQTPRLKISVGLTEQRATSSKVRAAEEAMLAVTDAIFLASDIPRIRDPF